jgi:phosphinothricin acetyltransferase
MQLRYVKMDDAAQLAEIYDPLVRDTVVSFETEPPGPEIMAERIAISTRSHPWIVMEHDGLILGYAYAGPYRARSAYRWSVETTIYLRAEHRGRGLGKTLYTELLDHATRAGYATAYAGIALPNPVSASLHRSVGFEPIGVFPRAGFKLGEWRDVEWWYRPLAVGAPAPNIEPPA